MLLSQIVPRLLRAASSTAASSSRIPAALRGVPEGVEEWNKFESSEDNHSRAEHSAAQGGDESEQDPESSPYLARATPLDSNVTLDQPEGTMEELAARSTVPACLLGSSLEVDIDLGGAAASLRRAGGMLMTDGGGDQSRVVSSMAGLLNHTPMVELGRLTSLLGLNGLIMAKMESHMPSGSSYERVYAEVLRMRSSELERIRSLALGDGSDDAKSLQSDANGQENVDESSQEMDVLSSRVWDVVPWGEPEKAKALIGLTRHLQVPLTIVTAPSLFQGSPDGAVAESVGREWERLTNLPTSTVDFVTVQMEEGDAPGVQWLRLRSLAEDKAEMSGGVFLDSAYSSSSALAGYRGLGPELWTDTEGKLQGVVSAGNTGATLGGVSRFLGSQGSRMGAHRSESAPKGYLVTYTGPSEGLEPIEGVGFPFLPPDENINTNAPSTGDVSAGPLVTSGEYNRGWMVGLDGVSGSSKGLGEIVAISGQELSDVQSALLEAEGLFSTPKSALSVAGAVKVLRRHPGGRIVALM